MNELKTTLNDFKNYYIINKNNKNENENITPFYILNTDFYIVHQTI